METVHLTTPRYNSDRITSRDTPPGSPNVRTVYVSPQTGGRSWLFQPAHAHGVFKQNMGLKKKRKKEEIIGINNRLVECYPCTSFYRMWLSQRGALSDLLGLQGSTCWGLQITRTGSGSQTDAITSSGSEGQLNQKSKNTYFSHYLYLVSGYLSILVGVAEFGRFWA